MFNERMPWQETYLNIPLRYLLSINIFLFWTKGFAVFSIIYLIINRFRVNRKVLVLMLIVLVIYGLIRSNVVHYMFNTILFSYDFNAPSLNVNKYVFF